MVTYRLRRASAKPMPQHRVWVSDSANLAGMLAEKVARVAGGFGNDFPLGAAAANENRRREARRISAPADRSATRAHAVCRPFRPEAPHRRSGAVGRGICRETIRR